LAVAVEDLAADRVAGGAMVKARGVDSVARVARQQEPDADPSLAGLLGYGLE
jgi:hypothetical protein